ncbi:MAG: hypothetical protein ACRC1K_23095, partial [Planctomycetia bacterium]
FLNPYPGRFTVWMLLAGRGALESLDGRHRERYETGTTLVAPAAAAPWRWRPLAADLQLAAVTLPSAVAQAARAA